MYLSLNFTNRLILSRTLKLGKFILKKDEGIKKNANFAPGEMAERSNAAVLKTVDCNRSGGSNPSFSAEKIKAPVNAGVFHF
jgi:hypothetical protein